MRTRILHQSAVEAVIDKRIERSGIGGGGGISVGISAGLFGGDGSDILSTHFALVRDDGNSGLELFDFGAVGSGVPFTYTVAGVNEAFDNTGWLAEADSFVSVSFETDQDDVYDGEVRVQIQAYTYPSPVVGDEAEAYASIVEAVVFPTIQFLRPPVTPNGDGEATVNRVFTSWTTIVKAGYKFNIFSDVTGVQAPAVRGTYVPLG